MKISTKGRYAIRLLIDLAEHQQAEYISLNEIATRQNISKKYLEQIIPILNKTGILRANRGSQGGYMLAGAGTFYHAYLGFGIVIALTTTEIILICLYDRKINQKVKAILQNGTE